MKIAVFMDLNLSQINGVTNCYNEMINYLKKHPEHQAIFLTYGQKYNEKKISKNVKIYEINNLRYNIPYNPEYPLFCFKKPYKRLLKICKEFKPDIIHTATPSVWRGIGSTAIDIGKEMGIKVVGSYHTHIIKYNTPYMKKPLEENKKNFYTYLTKFCSLLYYYEYKNKSLIKYKEELKNLNIKGLNRKVFLGAYFAAQVRTLKYNECDLVLAPTKEVKKYLSRIIKKKRIKIFSRGVDTEKFNPKWRSEEFRKKYGLIGKKVLLYVGRVAIEKNLDKVVEYYKKEKNKDKNSVLLIVGDGPYKGELEKRYPDIIFMGSIVGKKLSRAYASSDEFVFFSDTETFGSVLTEARSSGLNIANIKKMEPKVISWEKVFKKVFSSIRV